MVQGRGFLMPPGDGAGYGYALVRLAENAEERRSGSAAREFAVNELDRKKILSQFTDALNSFTQAS